MSKRSSEENGTSLARSSKRFCLENEEIESQKVLRELSVLFPEEKFCKRVPRVVMKHMIYSRLTNRTKVDKEIDELQHNGVVRMFKLGGEQESLAILFEKDFIELIKRRCANSSLIEKFVKNLLKKIRDINVDKSTLAQSGFSENDIKGLVQDCLLTVRSATTYWFCFPGAGEFMKCYIKGRQAIISAIKKSKYQQILQNELESRNMKKTVQLGVAYHIHDIIGADLVSSVPTSSGPLLRFSK